MVSAACAVFQSLCSRLQPASALSTTQRIAAMSRSRTIIMAPSALFSSMMASDNRRRLLDHFTGSPTFVATHCRLTGDFEADGPVTMCGIVRGDGRVGGALHMPVGSQWHGEVHAKQAVITVSY